MTTPVAFLEEQYKMTIYEYIRISDTSATILTRETLGISVLRLSGMAEWLRMSLIDLAIADKTAGYSTVEHSAKNSKYVSLFASLVIPEDDDV